MKRTDQYLYLANGRLHRSLFGAINEKGEVKIVKDNQVLTMKKQILSIIMAGCLLLSMTACSSDKGNMKPKIRTNNSRCFYRNFLASGI